VAAGQNVTWLGSILLSAITFFNPALPPGVEVVQRVAVQDMTATTGAAAREGGAGVHDAKSDVSGLTIAGATAVCSADLMNFSAPLITAGPWTTEDLNAEPGRQQTLTVDDEFGSYTTSLVITKVSLTFSQHLNRVPFRVCEAASTRVAALLDAVVTR
jgi:hypothetical protein